MGLSSLAFQLIGENIDFQSEIELVLTLLSKEYKNEEPQFLKVAAGYPEVLLGKSGQGQAKNLNISFYLVIRGIDLKVSKIVFNLLIINKLLIIALYAIKFMITNGHFRLVMPSRAPMGLNKSEELHS